MPWPDCPKNLQPCHRELVLRLEGLVSRQGVHGITSQKFAPLAQNRLSLGSWARLFNFAIVLLFIKAYCLWCNHLSPKLAVAQA
jgi:hypothetical protein